MVDKKAVEDFKVFAEGVKRLKELEKELNSLNTRKFRNEAQNIRRKLKSVHAIPQIERELNELKAKISGIDIDFLKSKLDFEQTRKINELEKKGQELEKQIFLAKKGTLNEPERKEIEGLPLLKNRVLYLRELTEKEDNELRKELEGVRKEKIKKQLNSDEINNVDSIPNLKGKVEYLRALLKRDESELQRLTDFFIQGQENFKLISKKIEKIPELSRKTNWLGKLFGEERDELHVIEDRMEKLPALQGKITHLLNMLQEKSSEISKEAEEIDFLKHKLSYFKKVLEEKEQQIQEELKKAQDPSLKKKLLAEMNELENKISSAKDELYVKFNKEISESKWMIQKQREELDEELEKLAKASAKIIEEEKNETISKLISELTKINQKIEGNRDELGKQFARHIGDLRRKINELEQVQKTDEIKAALNADVENKFNYLKEKLEYLERTQKLDELRGRINVDNSGAIIARSKALGITPKYLQKIESLENLQEPKKIREINPIIEQKKEPKIKFRAGKEIPELPPMPLTAEELQMLMPKITNNHFMPNIRMETDVSLTSHPSLKEEKELDIYEIKKEITAQKLNFPKLQQQPDSIILQKPKKEKIRKMRVPNRRFLEQDRFVRFVNSLDELKNLSQNYEGLFEDVKELKSFNKNSSERALEDSHLIRENLAKINLKLFTGIKTD